MGPHGELTFDFFDLLMRLSDSEPHHIWPAVEQNHRHWTTMAFIGPAHACCSFLTKLRLDVNQSRCEEEQGSWT
jgi:hypothetical protein